MKQVKCDICGHVGTGKERSPDGCSIIWEIFRDETDRTYHHDIDTCVKCSWAIQQAINSKIRELREAKTTPQEIGGE